MLSQKPDLPHDCALALAFPLSREEFFRAAETDPSDGFIRQWINRFRGYPLEELWADYAPIAKYANSLVDIALGLGVRVESHAGVEEWANLAAQKHVTTLVAHWSQRSGQDFIQFAEGFVSAEDCAKQLPCDFDGVLDLTICRSTRMIKTIKSRRQRCTVLANRNLAGLEVRLAIYRQVLRLLDSGSYTFIDAMRKIHTSGLEEL